MGPLDDKRVRTSERGFCVEPFTHGSRYNHRCWILSGTLAHLLSFLSFPSPSIKDLLIFKATSAATLSCLGECLSMLQHNLVQALNQNQNQNHAPSPSLSAGSAAVSEACSQRCSSGVNQVEPGGLRSASQGSSPRDSSHSGTRPGVHNHIQSQSQAREHAGGLRDVRGNLNNQKGGLPLMYLARVL